MTSQTARARPQVERLGPARGEVHGEPRAGVDRRDDRGALRADPGHGSGQHVARTEPGRLAIGQQDVAGANRHADVRPGRGDAQRHLELGAAAGEPAGHGAGALVARRHRGVEEVFEAGQRGQRRLRRVVEHFVRRAAGGDPSVFERDQPVAEREGLAVAVGHVEHGDAPGLVPALEVVHDVALDRVVERRQRLVEQQRFGVGDERAGQRRALTLAAGNLVRAAAEQPFDVERLGGLGDALLPLVARQRRQAVADVLRHGHVREERELLEDVAEAPLRHRDVRRRRAVEEHPLADRDAAGVRAW